MKKNRIVTCLTAAVLALALVGVTACSNGSSDDDEETPVTTTSADNGSGSGSGSGGSGSGGSGSGTPTVVGFMYITGVSATQAEFHYANSTYTAYDNSMTTTVTYAISGSTITFTAGSDTTTAAIISGTSFKINFGSGGPGSGSGTISTLSGKTYVGNYTGSDIITFTEGTAPSAPSYSY